MAAAEKKIERSYTIPLRREFLKVPKYKRAKKASKAVKEFLIKHMKSAEVFVGTKINEEVWKNGMRNPPSKVKVTAVKDEKGVVRASLFGAKVAAPAPAKKKADKKAAPKVEEKKVEEKPVATGAKAAVESSEAKE